MERHIPCRISLRSSDSLSSPRRPGPRPASGCRSVHHNTAQVEVLMNPNKRLPDTPSLSTQPQFAATSLYASSGARYAQ